MRDEDMGWGENVRFPVNNALGSLIMHSSLPHINVANNVKLYLNVT
jgi:hypothetical protein